MSNGAIALRKESHKEAPPPAPPGTFEAAGEDATAAKAGLMSRVVEALTVHTHIESDAMCPTVREPVPGPARDVLEPFHGTTSPTCSARSWTRWIPATNGSTPSRLFRPGVDG